MEEGFDSQRLILCVMQVILVSFDMCPRACGHVGVKNVCEVCDNE